MRIAALTLAAVGLMAAAPAMIMVDHPEIRVTPGAAPTAAAYLTIHNHGSQPDRLLGARCDCAASVGVHQTTMQNGVARMSESGPIVIPAGGEVSFAPGGRHLMLTGLKAPIAEGSQTRIVLRFEKAGEVAANFAGTYTPGAAAAAHAHH